MLVNVCAHYCGTTILLESFETKKEAEEFMKNNYILHYADEIEDGEEDELIYADEMFLETQLPFFESAVKYNNTNILDPDELPF